MFKYLAIFLFIIFERPVYAQKIVFQDVLNGGVTGSAYNAGFTSFEGQIEVFIEPNSTIKKALLFVNSHFDPKGVRTLVFNSTEISFDENFAEQEIYSYTGSTGNTRVIKTLVFDVTNLVYPNQSTYSIIPPEVIPPAQLNGAFNEYYLYIVYENPNLSSICAIAAINNIQISGLMSYSFSYLNSINQLENVSLAINSSNICNTETDGSYVYIDNNLIGLIGGPDDHSTYYCTGVVGKFYYQSNTLFGLGNDTANSTMSGPDAIANIENYLNSNNSVQIDFVYQSNFAPLSNSIHQLFLTYTSPCQPFEASLLASDTSTCANSPIQLGVTSTGSVTAYEWLPQTNLSCYDCPNPIFMGNTTTNYTVRIWASDSCSKVLPVRVRVLPEPSFESIEITESVCGGATGSIAVASSGLSQPHIFQINGGAPQNNGNFSNLAAGEYTITVTNAVGCSKDSVVVVGEFNNVQAAFSVNPTTGAAPLDISITNQSQNASEYFWDFTDEDGNTISQSNGHFDSAQCPLAGVYTLTLIAGNGAPHCNDTASVVILVKEPFEVFAYTFVTDDAQHYQIFLSGVSEYRYKLYSLDGKLVYQKSGAVENAGNVDLWEIGNMASAMYLFRVWVKAESGVEEEIKGKLVVVR